MHFFPQNLVAKFRVRIMHMITFSTIDNCKFKQQTTVQSALWSR